MYTQSPERDRYIRFSTAAIGKIVVTATRSHFVELAKTTFGFVLRS
jgi:hypothetical protein